MSHEASHGHDSHGQGSHGSGHNPYLAHHFETPEQQFSAAKLGMWLFMGQEVLFFSGLFCFYAVVRFNYPEIFVAGAKALNKELGALNTVVLLVSSLTMALGVRAAQLGKKRQLPVLLFLTFLCGTGFMVIKGFEYTAKYQHGTLWGVEGYKGKGRLGMPASTMLGTHVDAHAGDAHATPSDQVAHAATRPPGTAPVTTGSPDRSDVPPPGVAPSGIAPEPAPKSHDHLLHGEQPANLHRFFGVYFGLTALHGLHVLVGMGLLAWLFLKSLKGAFNPQNFTQVELVGLYWHLVDLIWIYLFPLLYLIG
ncbi:MAG: cytochrome c oxidase subunit 3 family protein [Planctomycetota bacterium]